MRNTWTWTLAMMVPVCLVCGCQVDKTTIDHADEVVSRCNV